MSDTGVNLSDYYVPVRQPVPTLHYDLSKWCSELLKLHPFPFPDSLQALHKEIAGYSRACPPFPTEKTSRIRIYVIDHRLYIPLILHDEEGSLTNDCFRFAKYTHRYEDNLLGEGKPFISMSEPLGYNERKVTQFIKEYDISPLEVLAVPTLAIFVGKKLDDYRPLGLWQVCALTHRYADQNLVDWSSRNASFDERVAGFSSAFD